MMGWFSIFSNKSFKSSVYGNDLRVAKKHIKKGVSKKELDELLLPAVHAGLRMVELLVENGADVNHKSDDEHDEQTALHLASGNRYVDVICYLVEHGADVNAKNVIGDTPLDRVYIETLFNRRDLAIEASANALTLHGGHGGHMIDSVGWGPIMVKIQEVVPAALREFDGDDADAIADRILSDKFSIDFCSGSPTREKVIALNEIRKANRECQFCLRRGPYSHG
ncbi:MAG: ankyrin repeat domain-containing protein [Candidatus Hydrogenedentota bacterium]